MGTGVGVLHNAIAGSQAALVVPLTSTNYAGTNHTRLTELLREREGIDLSRPSVRRILIRAGISSPRSLRSRKHWVRRQRMGQEGVLLHVDGSHRRWLEEERPRFTLLPTVDAAAGTVPAAMFSPRGGYQELLPADEQPDWKMAAAMATTPLLIES